MKYLVALGFLGMASAHEFCEDLTEQAACMDYEGENGPCYWLNGNCKNLYKQGSSYYTKHLLAGQKLIKPGVSEDDYAYGSYT